MNKTGEIEIGERIISFEKAETNPKWIMIAHNFLELSFCVFLRITSENVRPLTQFYEEIFKLHIFIESR